MPKIDSERFYTSAIEKFGVSAQGVNWASKENQELRFSVILKELPSDLNCFSIVDAGCGFGDFYLYLEKRKRVPKCYIGIDSVLDMYSIASQNTAQEIIYADICKDALPNADYYICSGALNVLTSFETQLFLRNCYSSSKIAFIFNALYSEEKKGSETYNYMTKHEIQKIANELKVSQVKYSMGYMENDVTVVFYR